MSDDSTSGTPRLPDNPKENNQDGTSEPDRAEHPTLDSLRAWEWWDRLDYSEKLEFILATSKPGDMVTDESLEVLAHFRDDALSWLRIRVRAREIGLNQYDLEKAVDQIVSEQRPRRASQSLNGVPPPPKPIPTSGPGFQASIEDFFDYTITSPKSQVFIPQYLAEYLMQHHHYRYTAGQLWVYKGGVYRPEGEATLRTVIQALLGKERLERRLSEVVKYVEVAKRLEHEPDPDCQYINLLTGRLDWATGNVEDHTPDIFSTIQLPVKYDPDATCPAFDNYLATTFDAKDIPLIEEILGWCMVPDRRFETAVMLTGEGQNGKSVFLDLIGYLLGEENVSHVALQDLEENRFRAAELYGKLANVFADLDARGLQSSSMFKTLTTGDFVTAERKHAHPFRFRSFAKLLFSSNKIPSSRDKSYAFYRRWLIIPFIKTFDGVGGNPAPDTGLRAKLREELPGILNRAIAGLKRLAANEAFTKTPNTAAAKTAYIRANDNVRVFIDECVTPEKDATIVKKRFYEVYERWCDRYGERAVSQKALKEALKNIIPQLKEWRETKKDPWHWLGMQWSADASNYGA